MKMFDATPLFRSSVGFDRMMDLFESVNRLDQSAPTYPPYNIEKTGEYEYRISLAVAGFSESRSGARGAREHACRVGPPGQGGG